jgi:o-succinylbenzoate synthase
MQIKKILVLPYCLKFKTPLVTAAGKFSDRLGYKIQVWDGLGNWGWGEAAPFPGWGMETLAETAISLERMQTELIGKTIEQPDRILTLLENYIQTPAARHGMELALLNLLTQNQISLAKLLNPNARTEVEVNGLIGAISAEETVIQANELINQGYKCLKLKIGSSLWQEDLERIKEVRQAIPKNIKLRLDPNQAWNLTEAIAHLKELESLDIEYIEQPLPAENLMGMAELTKLGIIAIAADEAVQNLAQLHQVIKLQSANLAILKPMALGGILTAFQAAQIAIDAGLEVVITTTLDGAIARLGALQLAAAIPKLNHACGLATGHLLAEDLLDSEILKSLSGNPIKLQGFAPKFEGNRIS